MYLPAPSYLSPGDTAWQLTSGTFVGLMSVPGLAVLYGGLVKKKWAINSAMMVLYAFSIVLVTWTLWGYQMGFGSPLALGPGILSGIVGIPGPALNSAMELGQAKIPLLAAGMPALRFPGSSLVFFQFVFAAIAPVLLAGSVLGRMNFKAWMLFVPLWSTFVYSINAFMLWGGGWLAQLGAVDYSGGYVIHLAAGVSGFVAAAVVGPRIAKDRESFKPSNLLMATIGAGIIWLGWNGFNGGDPYFSSADASAAVLNTDLAAGVALLTWMFIDMFATNKGSIEGAINGMICGLVAITPAAGYVNGYGAIAIGVVSAAIPWFTMNKLGNKGFFAKVDDTLGVVHTHGFAGLVGGLMVGLIGNPKMIEYYGTGKASSFSVQGLFYGNPHQFIVQIEAALAIIIYDGTMTWILLKLVGMVVPLRYAGTAIEEGDMFIHGEVVSDDELPEETLRRIAEKTKIAAS